MGVLSRLVASALLMLLFQGGQIGCLYAQEEVPWISVGKLNAILAKPSVTVIDVRQPHHWKESRRKIKGAVRKLPDNVGIWANIYPKDRTLVLYCQ